MQYLKIMLFQLCSDLFHVMVVSKIFSLIFLGTLETLFRGKNVGMCQEVFLSTFVLYNNPFYCFQTLIPVEEN